MKVKNQFLTVFWCSLHFLGSRRPLNEIPQVGCLSRSGVNKSVWRDGLILILDEIYLKNNTAFVEGGAISAEGYANLTMQNIYFNNNSALSKGGALFVGDNVVLQIGMSTFYNNSIGGDQTRNPRSHEPKHGGALYAEGMCTVMMDAIDFHNNTCGGKGGAIFAHAKVMVSLTNITFTGNAAGNYTYNNHYDTTSLGGALYAAGNSKIRSDHVIFTGNRAFKGGCISGEDNARIEAVHSYFYNNNAVHSGGANYIGNNAQLRIKDSNFSANTADSTDAVQVDCRLLTHFGHQGGAIFAEENSSLIIHSTFLVNNAAQKHNFTCISGTPVKGTPFEQDKYNHWKQLMEDPTDNGGGICISVNSSVKMIINHTQFIANDAFTNGGAVYSLGPAFLVLNNVTFKQNTAGNYGAAIFAKKSTEVYLYGSNLIRNSAELDSGICLRYVTTFHTVYCLFHSNTTTPYIRLTEDVHFSTYHITFQRGETSLNSFQKGFKEQAESQGLIVWEGNDTDPSSSEKETVFASGKKFHYETQVIYTF